MYIEDKINNNKKLRRTLSMATLKNKCCFMHVYQLKKSAFVLSITTILDNLGGICEFVIQGKVNSTS